MHKKFNINRTKIKGSCQSRRKVVTHDSKSDLPLANERASVSRDSTSRYSLSFVIWVSESQPNYEQTPCITARTEKNKRSYFNTRLYNPTLIFTSMPRSPNTTGQFSWIKYIIEEWYLPKDVSAIHLPHKHKIFEFWRQIFPMTLFVLISF